MDDVIIEPPYQEDSCRGTEKSRDHIIKIVSMVFSVQFTLASQTPLYYGQNSDPYLQRFD